MTDRIPRSVLLLCMALSLAGAATLHASLIGSIFADIIGGSANANFCSPLQGDAGNVRMGPENSCNLDFAYTLAAFAFGLLVTFVPLITAIAVLFGVGIALRSIYPDLMGATRQDVVSAEQRMPGLNRAVLYFLAAVAFTALACAAVLEFASPRPTVYTMWMYLFSLKYLPLIVAPVPVFYLVDFFVRHRRSQQARTQ